MGKILGIFWKNFFEIWENFFENFTTVYKAGYNKVLDLYNLITKIIAKYPDLTTFKILKITKKHLQFLKKNLRSLRQKFFFKKLEMFFCNFENFKSC